MRTKKQIRKLVTADEKKTASALGGRRIFLSGAGDEKGDGRVRGVYRIENKWTQAPTYRMSGKAFHGLTRTALSANEEPVFVVTLDDIEMKLVIIRLEFARSFGIEPKIEPEKCRSTLPISLREFEANRVRATTAVGQVSYQYARVLGHDKRVLDVVVLSWDAFLRLTRQG